MPEQASNNLVPFAFEKHEVRVVMINGKPWFVASDVAKALGYESPAHAVSDHCSMAKSLKSLALANSAKAIEIKDLNLPGNAKLIPEPDVYRLAAHSKLPSARRFEAWLYEDVLPSIRRTGSYSATPQLSFVQPAAEFKALFEVANLILDTNQAALAVNKAVRRTTGVDLLEQLGSPPLIAPKQERLLTVTEIGKQLGISARDTNIALEYFRYQREARDCKNKLRWELTEKGKQHGRYLDIDKRRGNGAPILQVKWYESVVPVLRADLDAMSKAMEELND